MNRFLSNCSSPHAINLFNTCSHFSQSEHDEACHFDLEFDPQLLLETSMFYPLVMVTMRNDESSQNEKVKGLLSVYHVKNLGNTRNSALLYQFLLCQNNASFPLKRLYMGEELCIVCQVEKSVVCLLPCGHRCVCSNCCFLIKATCPICRGQVSKTVFSRQDSNAFSVWIVNFCQVLEYFTLKFWNLCYFGPQCFYASQYYVMLYSMLRCKKNRTCAWGRKSYIPTKLGEPKQKRF